MTEKYESKFEKGWHLCHPLLDRRRKNGYSSCDEDGKKCIV